MSDHIEHSCFHCGSLLHHVNKCPTLESWVGANLDETRPPTHEEQVDELCRNFQEECEAAQEKIAKLESDLRLWKAVAQHKDKIVREELTAKGGSIEMQTATLMLVAAECRNLLDLTKAENYVSLGLSDDMGEFHVIIQRIDGKTPAILAEERGERIKELELELEELRKSC